MTVNRLSLLAITLCLAITGCSTAITATRDTPIQDDKGTRTFGSKIDDSLIETKVEVNVAKAATDLGNGASRIVVTSFNGVVLLAGQTPRADLKAQAEQAASAVQRVKKVHNELQVMDPITLLAISNDALLTTKIKAQMLTDNAIPGSRIKVVTDNGIVYLMGLLTQAEATRAANLTARGAGPDNLIASNADVNGRAQNRRVEVNLGPIPGQQYGQPGAQAPQQNNQFQGNPYSQYQ